jgi:N-glycosylase/DNA lyase
VRGLQVAGRNEEVDTEWRLPLPKGQPLHLEHSFRCGQIFRWRSLGGAWVGALGPTALALAPGEEELRVTTAGPPVARETLSRFLGLHHDLPDITRGIATDEVMTRAVEALPGMRILCQDPWECLITYISSAWNNIPKIERSMGLLAARWGTPRWVRTREGPVEVACFPTPEELTGASEGELRACGLGYRAPLVLAAARCVAEEGRDLAALRRSPYAEALRALLALPGVGRKVADCILLFSLEKGEAFPVDVWVRRLVHQYYASAAEPEVVLTPDRLERGLTDRECLGIQAFARRRWGDRAGYAQQYLFYARRLGIV